MIDIKLLLIAFLLFAGCKDAPSPKNEVAQAVSEMATKAHVKSIPTMKDISIDYCMGKFSPNKNKDFTPIPIKFADREGMYMRQDAYAAFEKMYKHAMEDNIKLVIRSAARNFDYQKGIWERKWTGATTLSDGTNVHTDIEKPLDKALKILEYSSMPGTSRHHWGTDIDLNAFENSFFESGEGKKIYDWLILHAPEYGFCQPYTPKGKERPHGYNEEKWHWSYMPVSLPITNYAKEHLKDEMIQGFQGSETAVDIGVVDKYVLGISQRCMH